MVKERLNKYRYYRKLLIEYKKVQISNYLDQLVENKIPTYGKDLNKQKKLTLFR